MDALVLGGTTFVGRRLVDHLVEQGWSVGVLNRGRTGDRLPEGVRHLIADRTDPASLASAVRGSTWDAVFDVSGYRGAVSEDGFASLVDELEGQISRYVFVSSIMVYEPNGSFPWHEADPLRDEPPTTYGGFKRYAECLLMDRHRERGFPATIARPAAIYGPWNNIYDMEAAMFLRLEQGRPVLVPYHGLVVTSYGHVDDLCRALLALATDPAAPGEAFNVTAGAATAIHYVQALAAAIGVEPEIRLVPDSLLPDIERPVFGRLFTPGHHGALAVEKARSVLGLPPGRDLVSGHRETYAWFQRSALAASGSSLSDPTWGAGFDLEYEASLAARCDLLG